MPAYVPGRRGHNREAIKVSSNETALPPLPAVVDAAASAAAHANRYPDMFATDLVNAIAEWRGTNPQEVVVGGGSVAVLGHVLQAFTQPGDEVVFAWRSFEAYPILVSVAGATSVRVPLAEGGRHDLHAMAEAITPRTAVIIVCTPNNPTGTVVHRGEFDSFMERVPPHVLVVVDEAYVEFVSDPDALDGQEARAQYPNVITTRTFSKAWGLASLRVGYACGNSELMAPIRACVTPFSVSGPAQAAAYAALTCEKEVMQRSATVAADSAALMQALRSDQWTVPDSCANFVWIPAGEHAEALSAHLSAQSPAIVARAFAGDGVRITSGTSEENAKIISGLRAFPDRF